MTPEEIQFERDYIAAARSVRRWAFGKYRSDAPQCAPKRSTCENELHVTPGPRPKRKNAPGAGRPGISISLSMFQVRAMTEAGKTSREIAAVAGCKLGVIDKMRQKMGITRPCADCKQPTGRNCTALYCGPCAQKRDKLNRIDANGRRRDRETRRALEIADRVERRWSEQSEAQA